MPSCWWVISLAFSYCHSCKYSMYLILLKIEFLIPSFAKDKKHKIMFYRAKADKKREKGGGEIVKNRTFIMSHIQSVVCWYIFLLFLMFRGVCSLVSSGMVSSCRSLSDHDWTFLFQLMIFVCGLRVLVRVYLRLVFFIFSLPLFFSCKCMLLFCNYISSFFLDLFFPLVPRVS